MEERIKIKREDVKIRKSWSTDMDPSTKVEKVRTDYKRSSNKQFIQDALDEMQEDLDNDF